MAEQPRGEVAGKHGAPSNGPRQWVNFQMYRLEPGFRRLESQTRLAAREEFLTAFRDRRPPGMLLHTYSTVGLRRDVDFIVWRISYDIQELQSHTTGINHTALGGFLQLTHSFLSMSKRSVYVDKLDPEHTESRLRVVPGKAKHLFVYPFVKTRPWYLLPMERRQAMMDQHIIVGNRYPSVKLHTTYSFGLDDQEFVVAFETDEAKDFMDLVMALRETQASEYTLRDTPMFTGVRMDIEEILGQLF